MGRECYGAFDLKVKPDGLKQVGSGCRDLLSRLGYRIERATLKSDSFRISAIRGSKLLAIVMQLVPLGSLTGYGSRVRVQMDCRGSLNPGDERIRLGLRCTPIREFKNEREWTGVTAGLDETIGDHLQTRRCYRIVVDTLAAAGLI